MDIYLLQKIRNFHYDASLCHLILKQKSVRYSSRQNQASYSKGDGIGATYLQKWINFVSQFKQTFEPKSATQQSNFLINCKGCVFTVHFCTKLTKQSNIQRWVFDKPDSLTSSLRVSCNFVFELIESSAYLRMIVAKSNGFSFVSPVKPSVKTQIFIAAAPSVRIASHSFHRFCAR